MKIPDPIVNYKEKAMVLNYRSSSMKWEEGVVDSLEYKNSFGKFYWSYTVRLNRLSIANRPIFLHVENTWIKKING